MKQEPVSSIIWFNLPGLPNSFLESLPSMDHCKWKNLQDRARIPLTALTSIIVFSKLRIEYENNM